MIGTFANVATIVVGSLIGATVKKGINERYQHTLMQAMGLTATALGISSIATKMPESAHPVLFIICLALGGLIGEILDIDGNTTKFISKFSKKGSNLSEGLSTAFLIFCIGTLSILGPIESAINGNHTYLYTNATLDLVTSMVLASTYGYGIIISAGILFVWQGTIYLSASYLAPFLTAELMTEISILGGILILCTGLNILKVIKIKTINFIPSLIIPAIYFWILSLIGA